MNRGVLDIEKKFLRVLQLALGTRDVLGVEITEDEWYRIFSIACKHGIVGVCVPALGDCPLDLKLHWIGLVKQMEIRNQTVDEQCAKLSRKLTASGYWNCILKGQGLAQLYPQPLWRQSGDIDVWVAGERDKLVAMVRRLLGKKNEVMYHHAEFPLFADTPVELHFTPTWMFRPRYNRRLQKFFRRFEEEGQREMCKNFYVPSVEFNALYVILHIYAHVFDEGIGFRQIIDYFYVLKAMPRHTSWEHAFAYYGILRFARGISWVLSEALLMPDDCLLTEKDERVGRWLLKEILQAGNFGKYDERNDVLAHRSVWQRLFWRMAVTFRRMRMFPMEALCEMPWRICHYLWRCYKGYTV